MIRGGWFLLAVLILLWPVSGVAEDSTEPLTTEGGPRITFRYTRLQGKACRELDRNYTDEGLDLTKRCKGVGGYVLESRYGDCREYLSVVAPDRSVREIGYLGDAIGGHFCNLGDTVEWALAERGEKQVPVALIVRVTGQAVGGDQDQLVSGLVVVKLTPKEICVTDVFGKRVSDQNGQARKAAETAADRPCMK